MIVGTSLPACPSVSLRPPPSPAGRGRHNSRTTSGAHRSEPGSTLCLRGPAGQVPRGKNAGSVPGSLFVRREGAWHRSHRLPRSAGPGSPRHETGRRRPIGAVAAPSRHPRATAPMGRRWDARGGPEGRRSRTPRHADRPHLPARPTASRICEDSSYDSDCGASPTLRRYRAELSRPPAHAGFDIVAARPSRPRGRTA